MKFHKFVPATLIHMTFGQDDWAIVAVRQADRQLQQKTDNQTDGQRLKNNF